MLERIKQGLRTWLGITAIEQGNVQLGKRIKRLKDNVDIDIAAHDTRMQNGLNDATALRAMAQATLEDAKIFNTTGKLILERFELAADINQYSDSWAVFVIKGRTPLVHFIDLRGVQPREIEELVMRYQGINSTLDTPFAVIRKPKSIREFI